MRETGECKCNYGWTSAPDNKEYEPSISTYHMCNVKYSTWYQANRDQVNVMAFIIALIAICVVIFIILLSCCLHFIYTFVKKAEKSNSSLYKYPRSSAVQKHQNDWVYNISPMRYLEAKRESIREMNYRKRRLAMSTDSVILYKTSRTNVESETSDFPNDKTIQRADLNSDYKGSTIVTIEEPNSNKKSVNLSNMVLTGSYFPNYDDDEFSEIAGSK